MSPNNYLENGYHIDRYHALEEDLLRFLNFVPLEFYPCIKARQCIRSTYLGDLLLRIGSNIDIFFHKYIRLNKDEPECSSIMAKRERNWNMGDFAKLSHLNLEKKFVTMISTSEPPLYPFRLEGKKEGEPWSSDKVTMFWWDSYNQVKHNGSFDRATLDNVVQALAALFILICHDKKTHVKRFMRYGYIQIDPRWEGQAGWWGTVERADMVTKLFIKKPG